MLPSPSNSFIGLTGLPQDTQAPLGGGLSSILDILKRQQGTQAQALPQSAGNIPGLPNVPMGGSIGTGEAGPVGGSGLGNMPGFGLTLGSLGQQGFQFGGQPGPSLNLGASPFSVGLSANLSQTPGVNQTANTLLGTLSGLLGGRTSLGPAGLLGLLGMAAPAGLGALGPAGGILGLMGAVNSIAQGVPGTVANANALFGQNDPAAMQAQFQSQREAQQGITAVNAGQPFSTNNIFTAQEVSRQTGAQFFADRDGWTTTGATGVVGQGGYGYSGTQASGRAANLSEAMQSFTALNPGLAGLLGLTGGRTMGESPDDSPDSDPDGFGEGGPGGGTAGSGGGPSGSGSESGGSAEE